jgi:rhamnosyltransferase
LDSSITVSPPAPLPRDCRRLIVYVVWDRRGDVEPYIPHALGALREHAARIVVVVNGELSDDGRAALEPVSDDILVRENVGFDIWGHKAGLDQVGAAIADYDEVVLTNDTWFGPVRPYGPVFERMAQQDVHFWGMTDHAREEPNPFTGKGVLHYHLQSFWIAIRRAMFDTEAWRAYWRELPVMPGYFDAVLKHEAVFTEHFARRGYTHTAAFPSSQYPTDHPALFNPDLLIADGCPLLKRRPFFHYPPFLDRHAVIGREILQTVEGQGYPMPLIWHDLARNVAPQTLNADAAMLEVLPDIEEEYDHARSMRIAAAVNIVHPDMTEALLDRIDHLPGDVDVFVTTNERRRADAIRAILQERGRGDIELRVVPSKVGKHMSAFLIGCREVLEPGRYDLIVKLHSKRSAKRSYNASRYFTRHQLDNLLGSPGYAANVIGLFQREPGLGVVFPPTIHTGVATMGSGWGTYRKRAEALARDLRIAVPIDEITPLAPFGGMWIARPEALRRLTERDWSYEEFEPDGRFPDAPLGPTIERLISNAAGELGFHARTVLNMEHAELSHTALEFKLDQLSSTTPGYPVEQIQFLHRAGPTGHGGAAGLARMYLQLNHPSVARAISPVYQAVRTVAGAGRRVVKGIGDRR